MPRVHTHGPGTAPAPRPVITPGKYQYYRVSQKYKAFDTVFMEDGLPIFTSHDSQITFEIWVGLAFYQAYK